MSARLLARVQQLGVAPEAGLRLKALLQPGHTASPGAVVVAQGAPATHLHFLEDGWLCSSRLLRDGRRQMTALALSGEFCDLEALALGACNSQITAVLSACRLTRVALAPLRELLRQEPSLAAAFERLLAAERLVAAEWIVNLGRRSALERIAHLMCEVAVRLGDAASPEPVVFALPMTQGDLADATGLSVVHVNRSLQTLRRQIGVVVEKRRVTIPRWAEIAAIAQFDPDYLSAAVGLRPLIPTTPLGAALQQA